MTPKKMVKTKWPKAYSKEGLMSCDWKIYRGPKDYVMLGAGGTPAEAWRDAALRTKRRD